MSKKIQTYNDLVEEKKRLETLVVVQKQQIKTSWDNLLQEATPVTSVFSHITKIFKGDKSNPAVNFGVKLASDVFIRKVVLAKADWVTRIVVPLLFRNYTSNILNSDKTKTVFGKVKALFQRGPKKNHSKPVIRENYTPQPEPLVTSTPATPVPTRESMQY